MELVHWQIPSSQGEALSSEGGTTRTDSWEVKHDTSHLGTTMAMNWIKLHREELHLPSLLGCKQK